MTLATRQEIAKASAEWEIIGPPEIRDVDPHPGYFNPWANPQPDKTPVKEPPGDKPPAEKDPPSKEPPVKEPKQIVMQVDRHP
jgi:hypothetical protein